METYIERVLKDAREDNEYVGTILEEALSFINDRNVYVVYNSIGNSCYVTRDYDHAIGLFEDIVYRMYDKDKVRQNTLNDDSDLNSEFVDGGVVLRSAVESSEKYVIVVSTKSE